ncbi:MAG TPA: crosslink repair DNA glycosylase YcaQ family protein [bacterium]|nr:crosslink repair DNA glycosylase YcaQ family protein [bacterium]HPN42973.1 crosslink repair DNA glycosylase YcaQ family protein [bacterium]
MKKTTLTLDVARKIALDAHRLAGNFILQANKQTVMDFINHSGYVQIDTLSVIQRAQHHVLWTRLPDYNPHLLHELHANDKKIFEYFARAASYLPMENYRFFLARMQQFNDPIGKWYKDRMKEYGYMMQPILERIRAEGPLASKDFEKQPLSEQNGKPARQALDLLALTGALMVQERRNFQKVYDLTERVLPAGINLNIPNDEELGNFAVISALTAMGIAREKEIADYLQVAGKNVIAQAIHSLSAARIITPVQIEQNEKVTFYILTAFLNKLHNINIDLDQVHLLSPFDNLIIFRERANLLFNFDYSLECYVPPDKRRYGYFVLPILWGERIVARMDPAVDKKNKTLVLHSLFFEPEFKEYAQFMPAFVNKCYELAKFNNCEKLIVEKTYPENGKEHTNKYFNL